MSQLWVDALAFASSLLTFLSSLRHRAGSFEFAANSTGAVGFRVLASNEEYTDILYDISAQNLTINRDASSLIKSYNNMTDVGKLKLWPIVGTETLTLNLTVVVDNSVIEVFANDELAITTRVSAQAS